jgi:hypothetical protein
VLGERHHFTFRSGSLCAFEEQVDQVPDVAFVTAIGAVDSNYLHNYAVFSSKAWQKSKVKRQT